MTIGQCRVTISNRAMPDGSELVDETDVAPIDSPDPEVLHPRISSQQYSSLKATVPDGGGPINFDL